MHPSSHLHPSDFSNTSATCVDDSIPRFPAEGRGRILPRESTTSNMVERGSTMEPTTIDPLMRFLGCGFVVACTLLIVPFIVKAIIWFGQGMLWFCYGVR
jgi:hypothetical protein